MKQTTTQFQTEVATYYDKYTLMSIHSRITKLLRKEADKLAREIVDSYDFEQRIENKIGDKIIITSVLTKKESKT